MKVNALKTEQQPLGLFSSLLAVLRGYRVPSQKAIFQVAPSSSPGQAMEISYDVYPDPSLAQAILDAAQAEIDELEGNE